MKQAKIIVLRSNPNIKINPEYFFSQDRNAGKKYDLPYLANRIYDEYILSKDKKSQGVKSIKDNLGIESHVFRSIMRLIIDAMKKHQINTKRMRELDIVPTNESYKDFLFPATDADNITVGNIDFDELGKPMGEYKTITFMSRL